MTNEEHIKKLRPGVQRVFSDFFVKTKEQGFDLRITSGLRTMEEQAQLYANGRGSYVYNNRRYYDLTGKIVTNAKPGQSNHNSGRAIDIVDRNKGYDIDWPKLAKLGKSLGLSWGGDFAGLVDKPHFEALVDSPIPSTENGSMFTEKDLREEPIKVVLKAFGRNDLSDELKAFNNSGKLPSVWIKERYIDPAIKQAKESAGSISQVDRARLREASQILIGLIEK